MSDDVRIDTAAAAVQLNPEMMQQSKIEVSDQVGYYANMLVMRMTSMIWSRHVGDHVVRYPANWWQAFKQRFFPYWARQRWPVLETTVVVTAYHDYPGLVIHNREPRLHYRQREAGPE